MMHVHVIGKNSSGHSESPPLPQSVFFFHAVAQYFPFCQQENQCTAAFSCVCSDNMGPRQECIKRQSGTVTVNLCGFILMDHFVLLS